jgi:hypothetical protein
MTWLLAHAFGQRYELPIPLSLFLLAGAGVVLLSFFLVINRHVTKTPRNTTLDELPVRETHWLWMALSLIGLTGAVAAGFTGSQEVAENIVPTLFWVVIWVGVSLSCGVIGDWTQPLNPFANLAKLADRRSFRRLLLGRDQPYAWGAWLGWWPAAALFCAVIAAELIFNQTMTLPANLALALLTYAVASAFMGLVFGRRWLQRGEVFTVLFDTWGRLGAFRFGASGRRGFLGGLDVPFAATASRVAFVILLLSSVSFDGLLSTPLWSRFATGLPDSLSAGTVGYAVLALLAFAGVSLLLWGMFTLFAMGVSRAGGRRQTPLQALTGLLPSLLPISFGYLLAHYLQYLLVNAQLMLPLLGNPTGSENWPLLLPYPFNDNYEVNVHILPTSAAWYIAVAVIIAAHVLAVILAHRHLAGATTDATAARRSEYPWIAAMVAYTMLSLWLLAQPLVKEDTARESRTSASPTIAQLQLPR